MTVAALPATADYIENGATVSFAVPFRFKDPTQLAATRYAADGIGTVLTYGVDFTATGGTTDAGGTLTTTIAAVAGTRLHIARATPRAQVMHYTSGDRFPAASHEGALDTAMLIDQEQDGAIAEIGQRVTVAIPGIIAAGAAAVGAVAMAGATQIAGLTAQGAFLLAQAISIADPTSYAYSAARWPEQLKMNPTQPVGNFVNVVTGDDGRASGTYFAPIKSLARAFATSAEGSTPLMLMADQNFAARSLPPVAAPNTLQVGAQFGSVYNSGLPRNVFNVGSGLRAPLIDARMKLAGSTWTKVAGRANTWETNVTLLFAAWDGVGSDTASRLAMYLDSTADDQNPGPPLTWITGGANVAANDAAIDATTGQTVWGANVVGSTVGDIRNTGGASTAVRLTVKMADNSNPNGRFLRLTDAQGVANWFGGDHGHLRLIGGAWKDQMAFFPLSTGGPIPTFESYEHIDSSMHGGVGPRNVLGLVKLIGRPVVGDPYYAQGRTGGGGHHLFYSLNDQTNADLFAGSIDIENYQIAAIYGHVAGNLGYRSFTLRRGGTIKNCGSIFGALGTNDPQIGFFRERVDLLGQIIATDMTGGHQKDACKVLNVPGIPGQRSLWRAKGPANAEFLNVGYNGSIYIANQDVDFRAVGAPPVYYAVLIGRNDNVVGAASLDTVTFDNVVDVGLAAGGRTGFFREPNSALYPNQMAFDWRLLNGTTLGDVQGPYAFNLYPNSLYCDNSAITIGFGGQTRAQVRAAMAALGRACTLPNSVRMVNYAGATVDAPA